MMYQNSTNSIALIDWTALFAGASASCWHLAAMVNVQQIAAAVVAIGKALVAEMAVIVWEVVSVVVPADRNPMRPLRVVKQL
jgi:hypothetical protein